MLVSWGRKALFLFALTLLGACAGPAPRTGDLPGPGQLVGVHPQPLSTLPEAGQNWMVSYVTTGQSGRDTVVQGLIHLPKAPPPAGGYPVVSWGAGATGVAPQCAPSLASAPSRLEWLNVLLRQGYAVLRTDYDGWGALGRRIDLGQRGNANAMADLVTAAHALPLKLSRHWVAAGHSQGGGAALWVGAARERTPGYPLKGAVALSPVGPGVLKFLRDVVSGEAVGAGSQPFVAITALSAQAADPGIDLDRLVHPAMKPQLDAALSTCIGGLFNLPLLAPGQYLRAGPDFDRMAAFFAAQDPSQLRLQVPVFVAQGEKDQTTVRPPTTRAMVSALCSKGARVHFKEYPGEDHGSTIMASSPDALRFIAAALHDQPTPNDCR